MLWADQLWIDPVITPIIVAIIVVGTLGLFRESMNPALRAVPKSVDMTAVKRNLAVCRASWKCKMSMCKR